MRVCAWLRRCIAAAACSVPALALPAPPQQALLIDGFAQSSPTPGAQPTRRTELRLWSDARTLFAEIRALDPQPGAIAALQLRRDAEGMLSEDHVALVIDVDGAGRNGFLFAVNANGAQFDGLVYDGGRLRQDWDAQWESEAHIGPGGWSARLAIPLAVLGQGGPEWRINAERWMPRGSERVRLAGLQPDLSVYSLGNAIAIPAMHAARDGWGLRLKPSLRWVAESAAVSGTGRREHGLDAGLELFHRAQEACAHRRHGTSTSARLKRMNAA